MADNSSVNKRRRTAPNNCLSINNIPDAFLSHVAIYLAKPQQALFAIALYTHQTPATNSNNSSTSSSEWVLNATSNVIISATSREQWQELDFGDIEKSLAAKLTDEHVRAILRCVDAPTNLKTLRLAGCVNVTGSCLDIMTNTSLENIDISLVGRYERPRLDQETQLSEDIVIPILDSIMGRGSLKLLQLPWKFRNEPTTEMEQFLVRYEQYLSAFRYKCSKCDTVCRETGHCLWMYIHDDMRGEDFFGTQNYTCYQCMNYYCYGDACEDENGNNQLRDCECVKEYCKNCISCECWGCGEIVCNDCSIAIKMKACDGEDCTDQVCERCIKAYTCSDCNRTRCHSCVDSAGCSGRDCNNYVCIECVEMKGDTVCIACFL